MSTQILVVEDNISFAQSIQLTLEMEKYTVLSFFSVKTALVEIPKCTFDLALLDIEFPDGDGFQVVKLLRQIDVELPIIFISGRSDESDVVRALELGADDYIRKPFGNRELLARIKNVLKKKEPAAAGVISFQDLKLDLGRNLLTYQNRQTRLRKREVEILCLLIRARGENVSRDKLMEENSETFDRTIDSHISHLRRKIRDISENRIHISAAYGFGYYLKSEGEKP